MTGRPYHPPRHVDLVHYRFARGIRRRILNGVVGTCHRFLGSVGCRTFNDCHIYIGGAAHRGTGTAQ